MIRKLALACAAGFFACAASASETYGDWTYEETQNPLTDEWTWTARTENADDGFFAIQCDSIGLRVTVRTDSEDAHFQSTRRVSYGFDRRLTHVSTWSNVDADKGGGAVVEGKEAKRIARLAARGRKFLYRSEADTVTFSLKGSAKAISRVADKCKYL
ncbi:MAG: hypothetical protein ACLFWF_07405 [Alphaproteobacteria bacterium]